jgi:hypothetical protein
MKVGSEVRILPQPVLGCTSSTFNPEHDPVPYVYHMFMGSWRKAARRQPARRRRLPTAPRVYSTSEDVEACAENKEEFFFLHDVNLPIKVGMAGWVCKWVRWRGRWGVWRVGIAQPAGLEILRVASRVPVSLAYQHGSANGFDCSQQSCLITRQRCLL